MSQTNNEITQPFIYRAGDRVPKDVISVTIHPSVTQISDKAFQHCERLEIVELHKGVTSIGECAFNECVKLTYINLHESSVEIIDEYAFYGCESLEGVKFPPSLKRINPGAFAWCTSLLVVNLSTCPLLQEIGDRAFSGCMSLMAAYFPKSLQRIGKCAFCDCHSLISAEFSPTVHVHTQAFYNCRTLELRQAQEENFRRTEEEMDGSSYESIIWLEVRNDGLPIHKICSDPNITLDKLQLTINSNSNNHTLQQTDELGMTALHLLCLNPNATPEMLKIIANACPQAATTQAEIVTFEKFDMRSSIVRREMVTPTKLWLKVKRVSYDDTDFDVEGHMAHVAMLQTGLKWNDLNSIQSMQFPDSPSEFFGVKNETNKLDSFMQAATVNGMNLETVYHLAMHDPTLTFCESSFEPETTTRRKRARVV